MKLLAITAELHVFDGVSNREQPLRLGIALEGGEFIRICEQVGDSIRFDGRPLEPADLGEGGSVEVEDLTERLDPTLRGDEIEAVRAIVDGEGLIFGLALIRRDAPPFCIWIDDDEFRWGDEDALERALPPGRGRGRIGDPV